MCVDVGCSTSNVSGMIGRDIRPEGGLEISQFEGLRLAFSLSIILLMKWLVASPIAVLTLPRTACSKGADSNGRKSSPMREKAVPQ